MVLKRDGTSGQLYFIYDARRPGCNENGYWFLAAEPSQMVSDVGGLAGLVDPERQRMVVLDVWGAREAARRSRWLRWDD